MTGEPFGEVGVQLYGTSATTCFHASSFWAAASRKDTSIRQANQSRIALRVANALDLANMSRISLCLANKVLCELELSRSSHSFKGRVSTHFSVLIEVSFRDAARQKDSSCESRLSAEVPYL